MSITFKIKTNNNRVKQFQQVHKAEKQVIYQVELRNRWKRYVLLRVFTYLVYGNNLLLEYSQYLEDPATELSMLHKYPNVKALLSTIRLFRHLHRSISFGGLTHRQKKPPVRQNVRNIADAESKCLLVCLMNINVLTTTCIVLTSSE